MSVDVNYWRVAMILMFVITFTVVGWMAPVVVASNIPQNQVIEVHEFTAQDANIADDKHYICFDRTVHRAATAQTFTELYMIGEDGQRVEIESNSADRYFQEGDDTVVTPAKLPDNLMEGEYRYILVANFELADGRVDRTFAFESQKFNISNDVEPHGSSEEVITQCG